MNTKITIFALLSILIVSSCSSNNDEPATTTPTTLVSKWSLSVWKKNNVSQTLTSCDKQGYIQFNTNGTFERKNYYLNAGNCVLEGSDNGTYNYNSTAHKITLTFTDPTDGTQTEVLNNVEFTTTKLSYTWDEDQNGTDELHLEYNKN